MSCTQVETCELCKRSVKLTKHHLIPRSQHSKKSLRKNFSLTEMQRLVIWVCRSCHNHIHDTFTEKELALHYRSKEQLMNSESITKFVAWIATKPDGFKAKS